MVKDNQRRGLHNMGNTCYFNSALQAIYSCYGFRKQILNVQLNRGCRVTSTLSSTFRDLENTEQSPYKPGNLYNVARPEWFPRGTQQDSGELLRYILEKITEEHEDSGNTESSVAEICFGGELTHYFACLGNGCGNVLEIPEPFYDLVLNLPKSSSTIDLNYLLQMYSRTEQLEMYCDKCQQSENCEKSTKIIKYPEYFALSINRFAGSRSKNFTVINYPKILTVPEPGSSNKLLSYALISVIVHSGYTPTSGHYYCFGRDFEPDGQRNRKQHLPDEKGDYLQDSWYCMNDSFISQTNYNGFAEGLRHSNNGQLETSQVIIYQRIPCAVDKVMQHRGKQERHLSFKPTNMNYGSQSSKTVYINSEGNHLQREASKPLTVRTSLSWNIAPKSVTSVRKQNTQEGQSPSPCEYTTRHQHTNKSHHVNPVMSPTMEQQMVQQKYISTIDVKVNNGDSKESTKYYSQASKTGSEIPVRMVQPDNYRPLPVLTSPPPSYMHSQSSSKGSYMANGRSGETSNVYVSSASIEIQNRPKSNVSQRTIQQRNPSLTIRKSHGQNIGNSMNQGATSHHVEITQLSQPVKSQKRHPINPNGRNDMSLPQINQNGPRNSHEPMAKKKRKKSSGGFKSLLSCWSSRSTQQ